MEQLPKEMKLVTDCAIYLAKTLCIDTNATTAKLEQTITHEGKEIGRYKITIKKV